MTEDHLRRIRHAGLRERVVSADQAASLIRDGMVLGMSGFTRAGEAKVSGRSVGRVACVPHPSGPEVPATPWRSGNVTWCTHRVRRGSARRRGRPLK